MPYVSEITPLLIVVKLEEYDYAGATALAAIMLALAFVMLLAINCGAGLDPAESRQCLISLSRRGSRPRSPTRPRPHDGR